SGGPPPRKQTDPVQSRSPSWRLPSFLCASASVRVIPFRRPVCVDSCATGGRRDSGEERTPDDYPRETRRGEGERNSSPTLAAPFSFSSSFPVAPVVVSLSAIASVGACWFHRFRLSAAGALAFLRTLINELKAVLGPLSPRGDKYCSVACLTRYLEARNWNVAKSRKMLEDSLKWRAAYRPEDIRWPEVSVEGETGKMYRASFRDREGRTVVNTSSHEGQIRFLVYCLENAILSLPEGHEKMIWLIDFTGWTMANAVPIKTARETVNILQNHYPERLAMAFLFNPPKVFEAFWKVVKYFLDPRTIEKVKFVYLKDEESMKVMHKYIDPEVLPVEFGGKSNVVYNHEEFSELMAKDDIKTASMWAADAQTDHVINGNLAPEARPAAAE
ncbi:hypothetical protein U9M48_010379, partial [Paspalum notatum var. saurae]